MAVAGFLFRSIERRTIWLGLAVVALNLVDAFATLHHLAHGAEELNPLMRLVLNSRHGGPICFLVVKHSLASIGVLGVASHPRTRAAAIALWILVPFYGAIVAYQILLLLV